MDPHSQFFAAVREFERRVAGELHLEPLSLVTPERMLEQLHKGMPLLPLVPPDIPVDEYLAHLAEYRALLKRFRPELTAELDAQAAAIAAADAQTRSRLVAALVLGDAGALYDLATQLGVVPERLYFLGELALRPYLAEYAERLEGVVDFGGYVSSRCPVCGRDAFMGRIDPDNAKFLHCPACEAAWRFPRIACTTCGNTNPEKLGFFTVEGDDEHRVEHCGECGGYLKVINQRMRVRKLDFLLEDAATLHLDQLAEAEGYRKGGRPLAVQ